MSNIVDVPCEGGYKGDKDTRRILRGQLRRAHAGRDDSAAWAGVLGLWI